VSVGTTCTIEATDGTPALFTTNTMWLPAGAIVESDGACTVSPPAPAVKLNGTKLLVHVALVGVGAQRRPVHHRS
jgi:hypothetical protein